MSDIRILPLEPARRDDYLAFFDHQRGPAFADNPQWAKCYCHFYEVPKAIEWSSFAAEDNRIALRSRIDVGEMEGFLAYRDGAVVGWLNAQSRHKLPHCFGRLGVAPPPVDCAPHEAAVAVCFVVAPAHRRQGVARALLAGAIDALTRRGLRVFDGFPFVNAADAEAATDHYHGPLSLFLENGFVILEQHETLTVVRRTLR